MLLFHPSIFVCMAAPAVWAGTADFSLLGHSAKQHGRCTFPEPLLSDASRRDGRVTSAAPPHPEEQLEDLGAAPSPLTESCRELNILQKEIPLPVGNSNLAHAPVIQGLYSPSPNSQGNSQRLPIEFIFWVHKAQVVWLDKLPWTPCGGQRAGPVFHGLSQNHIAFTVSQVWQQDFPWEATELRRHLGQKWNQHPSLPFQGHFHKLWWYYSFNLMLYVFDVLWWGSCAEGDCGLQFEVKMSLFCSKLWYKVLYSGNVCRKLLEIYCLSYQFVF